MNVEIDDKKMAMAVLNGQPQSFETLITALDIVGPDDFFFVRPSDESFATRKAAFGKGRKLV